MNKGVRNVIVGFGKTGVSVAEHCVRHGWPFAVTDDTPEPTRLAEFARKRPVDFAPIQNFKFRSDDRLIVSPGVPLVHSGLIKAQQLGATLTNDIALFSELAQRPVVLITGSNGKSTVTHFVGQLLRSSGVKAGVGGNIGTPALDLLAQNFDAYVIEVSSYQLELADRCGADVGVLLNLSPDHLDRYPSVEAYYQAKTNVFAGCRCAVINRAISFDMAIDPNVRIVTFGSDAPSEDGHYGILEQDGEQYLMRGADVIANVKALPIAGRHNWINILAALASAEAMGVAVNDLLPGLELLTGLSHRCEPVENIQDTIAINDSKSTNPASTLTAIEGFAEPGRSLTLLLGGIGKGADFSVLKSALHEHVDVCYVYGRDRDLIASELGYPAKVFSTLDECLEDFLNAGLKDSPADTRKNSRQHSVNDVSEEKTTASITPTLLLFSPGCASFDQFDNFEARGSYFKTLVQELFK